MNEVNRIAVGLIELRIMKGGESQYCEMFESGKWSRVSAIKLHQLSFDKKVYDWLNQHYNSANNTQRGADNIERVNF